jgi:hypothetical protein
LNLLTKIPSSHVPRNERGRGGWILYTKRRTLCQKAKFAFTW